MRSAALTALGLLALCGLGCRSRGHPPAEPVAAPVDVRLDHLRRLGLDVAVAGKRVRAVALYAKAPDYRPAASPARDGSEGVACVDDAARAAVVYLRHFERTGSSDSLKEAIGLLGFVAAMERGDGEFANFIDARGAPNLSGPTSRKSFSYWGARALWALAEGVRVLGPRDPRAAEALRPVLRRAVARMARDVDSGRLVGGSATATAEALLGVLAFQRAEPSPALAALAGRTAGLLVTLSAGGEKAPWGARTEGPGTAWHAWGARSTQALAQAASVLGRPDLAEAARREADGLWVRLLLGGGAAEVSPRGEDKPFPQIAYGVSPMVEGCVELARATGDRRYDVLAGLAAAWFLGANPAGTAMYDEATGRTFDGVDGPSPGRVNRNSGAESTVEALLALGTVAQEPEAAVYLRYRPAGPPAASWRDAAARRDFAGPRGRRLSLALHGAAFRLEESGGKPVELKYWPAANPTEVRLARRLAERWNALHPDIQVRVQPLPAGRSSEEVLLAAIVGRSTPDICSNISSALVARLVRAGGVLRLDRLAPTAARLGERASPAMLEPSRLPDGGIYALPWKTNPLMLMYNVDLLADSRIAPPRTHSDFLSALRRLARDSAGGGRPDHWGLWTPLRTTWYERFYDFYPLYLAGSSGRTLLEGGKVAFDNEAAVASLELLRRAFSEGLLPRSNFDGRDPFLDGTTAMKIIGPNFLYQLQELKVPGLRCGVVPIPVPDGADPRSSYAFADLKGISIFSSTRHPEEAARFVAFLTSPEADRALIEETAQLPYRSGFAREPRFAAALARWPLLGEYAAQVERSRDVDIDPDVVEVFDILSEAYEAASIHGVVPSGRAIRDAAQEVRKVLHAR